MRSDPCSQLRESSEDIAVSGDEFAATGADMRQGAESISLQLEDELIGVEWSRRRETAWGGPGQHMQIITKR
jgi:hypothetical protein